MDEGMLGFVRQQLHHRRIVPQALCFEITETAAISHLATAVLFIQELKALGCRFALDDFGAGMSSFAYLRNLPVDILKIDGAFVRDIATDPIDRAFVETINHIGQAMGKETVAESAENEEILKLLGAIGVDFAQGCGISRPLPLDDWLKALEGDLNVGSGTSD
jgi:EAL domain-containing protein (putative c-di-GMP-specific phosphodiesterase class I)